MTRKITIDEFLEKHRDIPMADVRTPAEFAQGHIPGAFNIPLFTNEERVTVGITYKQKGREAAILLGFDLTGNKWSNFIRQALEISPQKKIAVHCWRGGMRSAAMAWTLDLYGFEVYLIQGGYKHYRRWAIRQFERSWPLAVVGGMTGSGKTRTLQQLRQSGEQIVDLEDLAQHQGSSYGSLNRLIQPTQEQFENELANRLSLLDTNTRIWIEDESQSIGKCMIPKLFWVQIREAILFDLQVPAVCRVKDLVREYGGLDKDFLVECTERIYKRLGPEQTKHAIAAIREDRMEDFVHLVLVYYDKSYRKGLDFRDADAIIPVQVADTDAMRNAAELLKIANDTTHKIFARSGLRL